MVERDEVITLTDDEGNEHDFTLIDIVEVDEQEYAILLPDEEDAEEASIFRLGVDENGEEILEVIEDDDEFDRVVEAIQSMEDEYDEIEISEDDETDEDDEA